MCVMSKVDELTDPASNCATQWLDKISPLIIKLKRCIEVMCSRANVGLTFIAVQVNKRAGFRSNFDEV